MKPTNLKLQAFGPYPTIQEIDFTKLSEHALFLVHGPTGSGKTTIFDGMCFALYGKTSGARTGEQMRCQYASDNIQTEGTRPVNAYSNSQRHATRGNPLTRIELCASLLSHTARERSTVASEDRAQPRRYTTLFARR
jgi:HrpA-like RNA helicase